MPENYKIFHETEPKIQTRWLPILVGTLLAALVMILWYTLDEQAHNDYHERVEAEADKLAGFLKNDMRARIPALQRLVRRWEKRGGTPKDEFISDAKAYLSDLPGIQALEWVDNTYHVRWIIPLAGNEKAQGLNLAFEEKRRVALERATFRKAPTMTAPVDLVQGGKGFLIYFPIFIKGEFKGFVLAVFRIEAWLEYVMLTRGTAEDQKNFKILISIDNVPVYKQDGWDKQTVDHLQAFLKKEILGHHFIVMCRPTLALLDRDATILDEAILTIGIFLSLLVAFIVHLFQRATIEAWRAHAANAALEVASREYKKTKDELQGANFRLTLATKAGGIGVWIWDVATNDLLWNDVMYELYDVPPDVKCSYDTWKNVLLPDDLPFAESMLQHALEGKVVFDTEYRIVLSDGTLRHIRSAARVERDDKGEAVRMTGVNWDITEIKEAEALLATERRRLADILEGTNVGTWEWNVQTGKTVYNERWAGIIGYSLAELAPHSIETWKKLSHPEDLERSGEMLEKHFNKEIDYYESEIRMKHKSGNWVWVHDRGKVAAWTDDGKPLLMSGTHQDITTRKQNEEKIQHLATHDGLTDLPSLKLAKDRIFMAVQMAERQKTSLAVLFLDLDGFKEVNDTHGHDAGDSILRNVARRLQGCVRKTDTVSRFGGDEFLIALIGIHTPKDAANLAGKMVEAVSKPFTFDDKQISVGISIGIAVFPGNGNSVADLIKTADQAMYQTKNSGKNGFTFAAVS